MVNDLALIILALIVAPPAIAISRVGPIERPSHARTTPAMNTPVPAWYPDPSGVPGWRWFDGVNWTERQAEVSAEERQVRLDAALGAVTMRGAVGQLLLAASRPRRTRTF